MQIVALLALCVAVGLSIWKARDVANLFVLANLVPVLAIFVMPTVAPFILEIDTVEVRLADAAWLFAGVSILAKALGYVAGHGARPWQPDRTPIDLSRVRRAAVLAFVAYVLLFAPILVEVGLGPAFEDPRGTIYEAARLGAGHFYFTAGGFLTLFAVLGLYSFERKWVVVLITAIASLPFGQKTRFLVLVNIVLVYYLVVHPERAKFRARRYIASALVGLVALVIAAFWYTSHGLDLAGALDMTVGFGSEYQFNFSTLTREFPIDYAHHLGGQVFFEDNFVSLIPRILWQHKPELLGTVQLSEHVLPYKFAESGASSFGPFGQPFADWGYFGLVQVALQDALQGYLLGRLEVRARHAATFATFLFVLSVGFGGIITAAGPINYVFWMLLNLALSTVVTRTLRA